MCPHARQLWKKRHKQIISTKRRKRNMKTSTFWRKMRKWLVGASFTMGIASTANASPETIRLGFDKCHAFNRVHVFEQTGFRIECKKLGEFQTGDIYGCVIDPYDGTAIKKFLAIQQKGSRVPNLISDHYFQLLNIKFMHLQQRGELSQDMVDSAIIDWSIKRVQLAEQNMLRDVNFLQCNSVTRICTFAWFDTFKQEDSSIVCETHFVER
jgi:hypothetical protein